MTKKFFKNSKNYIINEIKREPEIPVILLTHHGVNDLCNGYYINSEMSSGFVTNISELYHCKNLVACINGHVHSNVNTKIPGTNTKLLSNCFGYPGENKIVKYKSSSVLQVE
jgi:hypothetical protein